MAGFGDLFKVGTAAMTGPIGWATLGADVLGGIFGGMSQEEQARRQEQLQRDQMAQQAGQFNRTQAQSEGKDAVGYARSLDMAPMRDRASYLMSQRLMQTPGNFHPGDMFNRGNTSQIDQGAISKANAGYTPGMGGTGGGEAVTRALLARLGYGTNNSATPLTSQGRTPTGPIYTPQPPMPGMEVPSYTPPQVGSTGMTEEQLARIRAMSGAHH